MRAPKPQTSARYCGQVTAHLQNLTVKIHDRSVGSDENRAATAYVEAVLRQQGWSTESQSFDAIDWRGGDAKLMAADGTGFEAYTSPYAPGCEAHARLAAVSTIEELELVDASQALLLLHGDIARAPLIPKNFPFYSVDEQQRTIALLESCGAAAIICATAGKGSAASGISAAPMIEDGDFHVPSVFMTPDEGARLLRFVGRRLTLISEGRRIPSKAANIIGRINGGASQRVVITAHVDAKKNVPGALDNGSGVAALLLLSELLAGYRGALCIELVALNGEDHYAVPGQIAYMAHNRNMFHTVALNINIDGVGYIECETAYSFFGLPADMRERAAFELLDQPGSRQGIEWPQGDHSMFIQSGCPAIAVTSNWLLENMATQTITHTSGDCIDLVAPEKVVSCALSLKRFIEAIS